MDPGIAGLAGTALGGLIGVVGTLGAARLTGRDQKRTQHEHWRRQQRRDAYGQLLSQASELIRMGSNALNAYTDNGPQTSDLAREFDEAVNGIDTAVSVVSLEGPPEAALAALELAGELYSWTNGMAIALAAEQGHFVPLPGEAVPSLADLMDNQTAAHEASDAFIAVCQRLLDA
ncbi:hypothetical protein [Streptomyces sp. NPDC000351]|uniref:hypothetical protein n=1 Tax=Streptomyces sp. NPDC000351 TaxID=3154250 RepID=UPI00332A9F13